MNQRILNAACLIAQLKPRLFGTTRVAVNGFVALIFPVIFCSVFWARSALAADLAQGKKIFGERCVTCHGPSGAGDGPLSASLPAENKPRNLQTEPLKFATDDAKFKELLQKGGAAVGLNPIMPPAPGLSEADIDNLIAYVRTLKK